MVSLGPSNDPSGFHWSAPIVPLGDACLSAIEVDPADEKTWYAAGTNGVYQTHNGGLTWTHPLIGVVNPQGLRLVPGSPSLVYAGVDKRLFLSRETAVRLAQGRDTFRLRMGPRVISSGLQATASSASESDVPVINKRTDHADESVSEL